MAYCPDDGKEMQATCLHYNACYDCPDCLQHWVYIDGLYTLAEIWQSGGQDCPVHEQCPHCLTDKGGDDDTPI